MTTTTNRQLVDAETFAPVSVHDRVILRETTDGGLAGEDGVLVEFTGTHVVVDLGGLACYRGRPEQFGLKII